MSFRAHGAYRIRAAGPAGLDYRAVAPPPSSLGRSASRVRFPSMRGCRSTTLEVPPDLPFQVFPGVVRVRLSMTGAQSLERAVRPVDPFQDDPCPE